MIDKINCPKKIGYDIHPYLIALLKQAQKDTSIFPETITKERYYDVKNNSIFYKNWYVGLVGFCASFKGKWWGGYADGSMLAKPRDYPNEAIRNLKLQSVNLQNIIFRCKDYLTTAPKGYVIYCDAPYKDTTKYAVDSFDYDKYYNWIREMSKDNVVLISEYWMPDDFNCVWSTDLICHLDIDKIENKTEKLFVYGG